MRLFAIVSPRTAASTQTSGRHKSPSARAFDQRLTSMGSDPNIGDHYNYLLPLWELCVGRSNATFLEEITWLSVNGATYGKSARPRNTYLAAILDAR
jgi:hypothetical protein